MRICKNYYDLYYDILLWKVYNSEISTDEKYQLGLFKDMLKLLDDYGIKLEIINGD